MGAGPKGAQAEAADGAMVADDPAFHLRVAPASLDQCRHEHVIGFGLVGEAPAAAIDADVAGLAALEKVRERHRRSVALWHQ